jgi:hypothetical protein
MVRCRIRTHANRRRQFRSGTRSRRLGKVDSAGYLSEVSQRLGLDQGGTTGPENKWLLNKALRLPVTLPPIPRQPGIRAKCRALLGHWSADVPPEQGIAPTETRTIAAISGRVENCKFSLFNHKQQIELNRSSSTSDNRVDLARGNGEQDVHRVRTTIKRLRALLRLSVPLSAQPFSIVRTLG